MPTLDPLEEGHRLRSDYVRSLVQHQNERALPHPDFRTKPPLTIVQFWDNLDRLPADVHECMETWTGAENEGFARVLFDKHRAGQFIQQSLGDRYKSAFDRCYHPAMHSDYFRLCYIYVEGGFYIDADDVYHGVPIQHLFSDGRLKIQPLCYDMATDKMVPPSIFTTPGSGAESWIFYFDTTPLIATRRHPLVGRALTQATLHLENDTTNGLPEMQATAGPGNLTQAIFDAAAGGGAIEQTIQIMKDWEQVATSKWPLSYRSDARNWRLSNRKAYKAVDVDAV